MLRGMVTFKYTSAENQIEIMVGQRGRCPLIHLDVLVGSVKKESMLTFEWIPKVLK